MGQWDFANVGGGGGAGGGLTNPAVGGNTAGTAGSANFLAGGNNITLSQSANSITISAPITVAQSVQTQSAQSVTHSLWMPQYWGSLQNASQYGVNSLQFFPAAAYENFSFSAANVGVLLSVSTSSNSSWSANVSFSVGIYTRNASSLSLLTSGSQSYGITMSSDDNTTIYGNNKDKYATIPVAQAITPGDYWVAFGSNSATTNANWISVSNHVWDAVPNNAQGRLGDATSKTWDGLIPGLGMMTATAMPASVAFSGLAANGAQRILVPVMAFVNYST